MKKGMKKRNLLIFALAGVLLAVSFVLPGAVLALRDSAIESGAETVTMDEAELSLVFSLTAEEKLRLAGDNTVTVIPLDDGVVMDRQSAEHAAVRTANELGPDADWVCGEPSPRLAVGSDGRSLVLWDAVLTSEAGTVRVRLDDETGDLLGFTIRTGTVLLEPEPTEPPSEESSGDEWLFATGNEIPDTYVYFDYSDALIGSITPEEYLTISEAVLAPAGLVPSGLSHTATGVIVSVEDSDLAIRITVTEQNGLELRLNME